MRAKKQSKSLNVNSKIKKIEQWIHDVDTLVFTQIQCVFGHIDRRLSELEDRFKDKPNRKKPKLKKRKAK